MMFPGLGLCSTAGLALFSDAFAICPSVFLHALAEVVVLLCSVVCLSLLFLDDLSALTRAGRHPPSEDCSLALLLSGLAISVLLYDESRAFEAGFCSFGFLGCAALDFRSPGIVFGCLNIVLGNNDLTVCDPTLLGVR
ncbi:putative transport protein [Bufonid herpesvirus 1]|uniref:putative transport protein n=1 Tax=Bufonid herpesvirus 1 TaxID=2282206 RepID=UPI000EB6AE99|nr:putative transport protein [Bufonid herpesvirus 1]AXF48520.1 putative transport protein [Bufonid herpesvirus 1]